MRVEACGNSKMPITRRSASPNTCLGNVASSLPVYLRAVLYLVFIPSLPRLRLRPGWPP